MSIQPYIDTWMTTDPSCKDEEIGREERYRLGRILYAEMDRTKWYSFKELFAICSKQEIEIGTLIQNIRLLKMTIRCREARRCGRQATEYAILPSLGGPLTDEERSNKANQNRAKILAQRKMRQA